MTLIASTSNYGYPILIGDMIASSDQVTEELVIPVFSKGVNQYLPSNNRYRPSEFVQKIYIISDIIAAGFAGSAYEIKLVLDDLINHFKYKESTLSELESFIANVDTEVFSMSSAFFVFMNKEGKTMHNLFINKDKFRAHNNEAFQYSFAGGSGSKDFISIIENQTFQIPDRTNNLTQAIVRNYLPICKALISEVLELTTLSDNWGGGFEMIYFDGNKFIKMDNITYLFWYGYIDLETGKYKLEPDFVYNFKYFEELLLLSVFNFPQGDKREELTKYVVPPLNRSIKEFDTSAMNEMHKLNINNGKICNVFIFNLSDGNVVTTNRFDISEEILGLPPGNIISIPGYEYMRPNGKYKPSVTFEVSHNKKSTSFEFTASAEYLDRIVKEVEKVIVNDYKLSSFKLTQIPIPRVNSVEEEKLKNRIKILKIDGYSNKLIARELKIPLDTVLKYLKEIFNK